MNKKELIEKYKDLFEKLHVFPVVAISRVLKDLQQLDEPQKVTIPQFVADWYEENKDDFETKLFNTIGLVIRDFEDDDLSVFEEWILDEHKAPLQTLVNMHQFGYEVEKEKRYTVSLKNGQPLVKTPLGKTLYFNQNILAGNYKFTRKELEDASFGWVFDCEGIEIEEVD